MIQSRFSMTCVPILSSPWKSARCFRRLIWGLVKALHSLQTWLSRVEQRDGITGESIQTAMLIIITVLLSIRLVFLVYDGKTENKTDGKSLSHLLEIRKSIQSIDKNMADSILFIKDLPTRPQFNVMHGMWVDPETQKPRFVMIRVDKMGRIQLSGVEDEPKRRQTDWSNTIIEDHTQRKHTP